ncbi:LysM peptidoglycan-binding domain-containing protein [Candidatus Fermentibacteria bacterium]|nr:LysM peptidoglycan-binding domain-containing protein [Candidatus Fermentibacteria bacterium]
MFRVLIACCAGAAVLLSCGHVGMYGGQNAAIAEAELDAAEAQLALARELVAAGAPAGAASAYRTALELIAAEELPEKLQGRAEELAEAILDEYHLLLSTMPSLPGETPAWAVMAEMDSAAVDAGTFAPLGDGRAYDMPVIMNDKVARVISYFSNKGRKPLTVWLERMGMYEAIIRPILREHGLPQDLIYLAMIESGFNTRAQSYARAVGPWQFIAGTARRHDLRITPWVDERRDIVKSTHAACRYLKALYEQFGSWELAMAGYNCGEGKVERHVKQYKTDDYWKLHRLPRQTRDYVPTFMGAMIIAKSPGQYGFSVEPLPLMEWDDVELEECTTLDVAARCAGTTMEEMELLNAELRRGCTPPDERYVLRVPKGSAERFRDEYAKIPDEEKATWAHHRVVRGETLSRIARRYGTTVDAIKDLNGLRSTHMIREGAELVIPIPRGAGAARVASVPFYQHGDETTYRVRRGDTLGRIASRYGTTVTQICRWNGLTTDSVIYPGQTVRLWPSEAVPATETTSTTPSAPQTGMGYVVKRGETLGGIAQRHGVSINTLREANGIRGSRIYTGQTLRIPGVESPAPDSPEPVLAEAPSPQLNHGGPSVSAPVASSRGEDGTGKVTYTVKTGDSLDRIARQHGTSVEALRQANAIKGSRIYAGQVVLIPVGGAVAAQPAASYVVRRGDSLARIATKFGVTVDALRRSNALRGTVIHPGQKLTIPATRPASGDLIYTVRRGDSLSAIARRFGVTSGDIAQWNGIASNAVIYPGTTLTIRASRDASTPALGG